MKLSRERHFAIFILFTTLPFGNSQTSVNDYNLHPGDVLLPLTWEAPRPLKFQHWYPQFRDYFQYIAQEHCNLTLLAYEGSLSARERVPWVGRGGYCGLHLNCMLYATNEPVKANTAATSVLLGLTPSILAGLGPTIGEVALLSLHRPLLALLISLGAPGIYPTRIATPDYPFEAYEAKTGALVVPKLPWPYSGVISAAQYALTAAAAVNVFVVSYNIGVGSILAWWCEFSFMPVIWAAITVFVHLLAAFALRMSMGRYKQQTPQKSKSLKALWVFLIKFASQELTLSANNSSIRGVDEMSLGPVGIGLSIFASWFALCHLAVGTCVFAGVVFISTGDAAFLILRFLASGTICRIVIYFELGGMRKVREGKESIKWIVQPEKTRLDST